MRLKINPGSSCGSVVLYAGPYLAQVNVIVYINSDSTRFTIKIKYKIIEVKSKDYSKAIKQA